MPNPSNDGESQVRKQPSLPLPSIHPRTPLIPLDAAAAASEDEPQVPPSLVRVHTASSSGRPRRIPIESRDPCPLASSTALASKSVKFVPDNGTANSSCETHQEIEEERREVPVFKGVRDVQDLKRPFQQAVPQLSLFEKKVILHSTPKTESLSARPLRTASFTRSYQFRMERTPNRKSREVMNPLIVRSLLKPKLPIPQQLFKPKRNL